MADGPCAHARTLIADFCPISRCDGVIKSPFNSHVERVYAYVSRVSTSHGYIRARKASDNESRVRNVVRISEELVRRPTPPLARLIVRARFRSFLLFLVSTASSSRVSRPRETVRPFVRQRGRRKGAEELDFAERQFTICTKQRKRERERREKETIFKATLTTIIWRFLNSK